ncbi:hypothetical protein SAMN04489810_3342 [Microbacterium pygmaeum]|uniref:Uncharacterized protein n=2 Tax=Microbacterium pygmaeum TaxID=370764 RepID=A0A1G8DGU1_9MICO|nr:hypothetical protein SAMN04489810_3342 [Microbacterium pygmaeum]
MLKLITDEGYADMTDPRLPHEKHSDDAVADDAPPTDAVTDDVREDAAQAESGDGDDFPDRPALTHP